MVQTVAAILASVSATLLTPPDAVATVDLVTRHLPDAHILHLACHGQQRADPLESCFALRDGGLSVQTLMGLRTPHAVLAFLSACETAKGDAKQPDEAVHLAASLLSSGFRSVIATMWWVSFRRGGS
jgi:CHAT domain-containing protein